MASVFPCAPLGKQPLTSSGFKDATTDETQINEWAERWPDANIATPTGLPQTFDALDVDVPVASEGRHSNGQATLRELTARRGPLPQTRQVLTRSGGVQYHFVSGTLPNNGNARLPGIDVKASGAYVLLPPSVVECEGELREYKFISDRPVVAAPAWLADEVLGSNGNGRGPAVQARTVAGRIPVGERNTTLTSLGGSLRSRGIAEPIIADALLAVNRNTCDPPLSEEEVRRIAASLSRYEPASNLRRSSRSDATSPATHERSGGTPNATNATDATDVWEGTLEEALDELARLIRRYVVLSDEDCYLLALWVAMTYVYDVWYSIPYVHITAPVEDAGKSRLLLVLSGLVSRPWKLGSGLTSSVLIRRTDEEHPTLLLDEIDSVMRSDKDLRNALTGIINDGYQADGQYWMSVPSGKGDGGWDYRGFSTFSPKAFAGIGDVLTKATRSRCLRIEMKPKMADDEWVDLEECEEEFFHNEAQPLAAWFRRWAEDKATRGALKSTTAPTTSINRKRQVFRPLIAIASLAGRRWLERAVSAAGANANTTEPLDFNRTVLACIARHLDRHPSRDGEGVHSETLCRVLQEDENVPLPQRGSWAKADKNEALIKTDQGARELAKVLKRFGVTSRPIRDAEGRQKRGYKFADLEHAVSTYLPEGGVTTVADVASPSLSQDSASCEASHFDGTSVASSNGSVPSLPEDPGFEAALSLCRYPSHRLFDWVTADGRTICGVCHPPAGSVGVQPEPTTERPQPGELGYHAYLIKARTEGWITEPERQEQLRIHRGLRPQQALGGLAE
ncbi:hypothetical protein BH18ACT12_BH18ACT12_18100 [soil metagenome]